MFFPFTIGSLGRAPTDDGAEAQKSVDGLSTPRIFRMGKGREEEGREEKAIEGKGKGRERKRKQEKARREEGKSINPRRL